MKASREPPREPQVHYGLIASGNQVVKDANFRDLLNRSLGGNVLRIEMEAAGLMNNFSRIIIRGICDYADVHKTKDWQEYAAAVAAAYAKELLEVASHGEIKSTLEGRLVTQMLHEIVSKTDNIALRQEQQIRDREEDMQKKERHKILEWLSPLHPSARHLENQRQRIKGTGIWLLEDPLFVDWVSKKAALPVLCCYGDPGVGKTIIASLVIDKLDEYVTEHSSVGLSYAYCDYRDQKVQTVENIIGANLRQLLESLAKIPPAVSQLYQERSRKKLALSMADARELLRILAIEFDGIYICLDALDEISDTRCIMEFLRDRPDNVRVFLTGRPHIQDTVHSYLKGVQKMVIKARKGNIEQFINYEIGGPNDADQMQWMKSFAQTSRGKSLHQQRECRAAHIIAWVHLAEQPLSVNESLCSLSIKEGDKDFDYKGMPVRKSLFICCLGLITVDQETSTVRLVHYSFQEYLTKQSEILGTSKTEWHKQITTVCLTYINFSFLSREQGPEKQETEEQRVQWALLEYTARQWARHLQKNGNLEPGVLQLLEQYFCAGWPKNFQSLRLLHKSMYYGAALRESQAKYVSPAHIGAFFGIERLMAHLASTGAALDTRDVLNRTPLSLAAERGHSMVVKQLVSRPEVDVNSEDLDWRTPLSYAVMDGHNEVVRQLLTRPEVNVNATDQDQWTPLLWVARGGYSEILEQLLARPDLDVNFQDEHGETPLGSGARTGYSKILEQLLTRPETDVNLADEDGMTPLLTAASKGSTEIVRQLLARREVNIDLQNDKGRTALSIATELGHQEIQRLLPEHSQTI